MFEDAFHREGNGFLAGTNKNVGICLTQQDEATEVYQVGYLVCWNEGTSESFSYDATGDREVYAQTAQAF